MRDILLGYFRVSTQRQSTHGHALERYDEELVNHGVLPDNLYSDVESGGSLTRTGFNRLCDRIESDRAIRALVVPAHSRLHRDLLIWVKLRELLLRTGVDLIDLYRGVKPIDLRAIGTTLDAALAEEQRILNQKYALDGHRHRRSRGKSCTLPFGYTLDAHGICTPNHSPYHATGLTYWQAARKIVELYLESGTLRTTAIEANRLWPNCTGKRDHPSTGSGVRSWLKNEHLQGHLVYFGWRDYIATKAEPKRHQRKEIIYNHHPALLTPEEIVIVAQRLKFPSAPRGKRHRLAGIAHCKECGRKLERRPVPEQPGKSKAYEYLRCTGAYPYYGKPTLCAARVPHRYEQVEELVIDALIQNAALVAQRRAQPSDAGEHPQVLQLEAEIAQLAGISGAEDLIEQKRRAIAALKGAAADRPLVDEEKLREIQEAASSPSFWDCCTPDDRAIVYRALLERVEVAVDGSVVVFFKASR